MSKMTVAELLCGVLFLHVLCAGAITRLEYNDLVMKKTMPAYAVANSAKLDKPTQCQKELYDFRVAVDNRILWGLKMLDASGEPKPGFIYGNNFWLGSKRQCHDTANRTPFAIAPKKRLNNTRYRNPDEEFPPFKVNYFAAHFRHNSTLQVHVGSIDEDMVVLGLCLPASCTSNEIGQILQRVFSERNFLLNELYSADFRLAEVRDLRNAYEWFLTKKMMFLGCIIFLILSLMIAGTIYDKRIREERRNTKKKSLTYNNNEEMVNDTNSKTLSTMQQSNIGIFLLCFSVYTNTKSVFNTKISPDSVLEIHGLKFLSMAWIIAIHTLFFICDYTENIAWLSRVTEGFFTQVLTNGHFAVDTFFCIGGFLLTYRHIRTKMGKNGHRTVTWSSQLREFFLKLVKRYIRLTPAYVMTIGFAELNSGWWQRSSPFHMTERHHELCANSWWANVLYINNLLSRDTMCLSWSWYLSNDMQFFIIGNIILMISARNLIAGAASLFGLLIGSLFLSGYISYVHEYQPTFDEMYRLAHELYDPPWVRIGPYLVGMVTAYIVVKLDGNLPLSKRTIRTCGYVVALCNLLVLFGLWDRQMSVLSTAIYVALSRTVWAIGTAWLLIVCRTNSGGTLQNLFSWKAWVPLSKLTYCAYLLNPIIISTTQLYGESAVHVDFWSTCKLFYGNLAMSYIAAYMLHVMMEAPFILLMERIIKYFDTKKVPSVQAVRIEPLKG